MPQTQTERDLGRFAQDKLYNYLKDVTQAFEIAGLSGGQALACVSALFMRLSSAIAIETEMPRERWMQLCIAVFEYSKAQKEEDDR